MASIPVSIATSLAVLTLITVFAIVAFGATTIYLYYRQRRRVISSQQT